MKALSVMYDSRKKSELLTGHFYIDEKQDNLIQTLNLVDQSLASLNEAELRTQELQFKTLIQSFK